MKPASSGEIHCGGVPSASPTLRQRARSEPSVYQTVCDVAEFHDLDLSDQQIAANLPVLWSIAGDLFRSSLVQLGIEPPQKLTRATVTKASGNSISWICPRRFRRPGRRSPVIKKVECQLREAGEQTVAIRERNSLVESKWWC
jgi:hypothetical protein